MPNSVVYTVPAEPPHQSQVVLASRDEVRAVVGELHTAEVLVMSAQNCQQTASRNLQ